MGWQTWRAKRLACHAVARVNRSGLTSIHPAPPQATKQTVLHWVAQRGDPEAVSYVVQKTGKQLFAVRDVEGRIPADLAASEQIRKMLLD